MVASSSCHTLILVEGFDFQILLAKAFQALEAHRPARPYWILAAARQRKMPLNEPFLQRGASFAVLLQVEARRAITLEVEVLMIHADAVKCSAQAGHQDLCSGAWLCTQCCDSLQTALKGCALEQF